MWRNPGDVDSEISAFAAKVDQLRRQQMPVKIYPGCGDTVARGFLNLDISLHPNLKPDDPRWDGCDMFIFPFADMAWPLPDGSCDYIFHEDFLEHINQKQQIGFLAETLRVLKPGQWHRINSPCLINSLQTRSNFRQGFKGVCFAEWDQNGHVALMTRSHLTELAMLVGYREVFFNARNKGMSAHQYVDCRPGPDRDEMLGNLFADLLK